MYIDLDGWCLEYYFMSSIDNNIDSIYKVYRLSVTLQTGSFSLLILFSSHHQNYT
jgi:hypothetical protein